jgi:DNA-binding MarR family transcriptional regulator
VTDAIAVVRRFNRSYTQRIGALDDSFLGLGMPLGPARLLFEIGTAPATAQALRERLGLDSGYLSRLLRRLERDGLVAVTPDPADRRRRRVTLTEAGRARWQELERRSDDQARLIVEPLTQRQRERLARALSEADLLVRAATVRFEPADPAASPGRDVAGRYFAEIGRRFGFDPAGEADEDAKLLIPPAGVFVVAVSDGDPVACGGLRTIAPGVAELKRMWVRDDWRGGGPGHPAAPSPGGPRAGPGPRDRPPGHQQGPHRGDRQVRARRLPRDPPLQRQPLGHSLLRKAAVNLERRRRPRSQRSAE